MDAAPSDPDEARHRLYEIMKADAPFDEKARLALDLGRSYLGVDCGYVSRIDVDTDHYEVIISTADEDGLVPAGYTTNLQETYCLQVVGRGSSLAAHDVRRHKDIDEAVDGLQSYHGTELTVDGELYGTVCFVGADARAEPFSETETMFAELVGRLIEFELEHQRHRDQLQRQTSLVNVLDRVLRHNIRNDMTVIHANARIITDELEDCEECRRIVETASDLIGLTETARYLGSLINSEFERQPRDVVEIARTVGEEAATKFPGADISLDAPETLVVPVLPSLERAIWELLENAASYAGETPAIRVAIRDRSDSVEIAVSDDGPGLPATEQEALRAGMETPLVHGSGLGLWTVYWVTTTHRGSLDVDAEDGTTVTMQIPHVGTRSVEERPQIQRAPDMYQLAFRAAESPLALLDGAGRIVDVNDRGVALLDRARSDVLGSELAEITDGRPVQSVETAPVEANRAVARETATDAEREVGPVSSGGWEHRLVRLGEGDEGSESD